MLYQEARLKMESGDLVFFEKDSSFISWWVSLWTGSPYSHAAIVFRMPTPSGNDRLFVVEEHKGGQRIVNLASYLPSKRKMTIVKAPVPWESYSEWLIDRSGAIEYSYTGLVAIGLREKFGLKLKDMKGEVCSEMVAYTLLNSGVDLPTTQVSPGNLLKQLLELGYQVRCSIDPEPNPVVVS
jgi:hypothetical protein